MKLMIIFASSEASDVSVLSPLMLFGERCAETARQRTASNPVVCSVTETESRAPMKEGRKSVSAASKLNKSVRGAICDLSTRSAR